MFFACVDCHCLRLQDSVSSADSMEASVGNVGAGAGAGDPGATASGGSIDEEEPGTAITELAKKSRVNLYVGQLAACVCGITGDVVKTTASSMAPLVSSVNVTMYELQRHVKRLVNGSGPGHGAVEHVMLLPLEVMWAVTNASVR